VPPIIAGVAATMPSGTVACIWLDPGSVTA